MDQAHDLPAGSRIVSTSGRPEPETKKPRTLGGRAGLTRAESCLVELEGQLSTLSYEAQRALKCTRLPQIASHLPARQVHQQAARRLGTDGVAEVVAAYLAGVPTTELTETYGMGKGTVLRLLEREGVALRNQGLTDNQVIEAAALYKTGWSCARLGDRFGADPTTVHRALKLAGVQLRKPGRGCEHHPLRDSPGHAAALLMQVLVELDQSPCQPLEVRLQPVNCADPQSAAAANSLWCSAPVNWTRPIACIGHKTVEVGERFAGSLRQARVGDRHVPPTSK